MNIKLLSPDILKYYNDIEELAKQTNNTNYLDLLNKHLILELPDFIKKYFKSESDAKSIRFICDTNSFDILKNNRHLSSLLKKLDCNTNLCVKSSYLQEKHPNFFKITYIVKDNIINTNVSYITIDDIYNIFKKINLYIIYNDLLGSSKLNEISFNNNITPSDIENQRVLFIETYRNSILYSNDNYRYQIASINDALKYSYENKERNTIKYISNLLNYNNNLYTTVTLNKFFSNLFNLNCHYSKFIKEHSVIDYTNTEDCKKIYVATDIEQNELDKYITQLNNHKKEIENISNIVNTYLYSTIEIKNEDIKEVSGYDICKYYNINYYDGINRDKHIENRQTPLFLIDADAASDRSKNTLHNSCMRHKGDVNTYMKFYAYNKDVCKLVILLKDNKVRARALIWKSITGETLISRIYFINNDDRLQLVNHANVNNYINICDYPSNNNNGIILNDFNDTYKVKVTVKSNTKMPYLDNYYSIDLQTGYLLKDEYSKNSTSLTCRSTGGTSECYFRDSNGYKLNRFVKTNYKINILLDKSRAVTIPYLNIVTTREIADNEFNFECLVYNKKGIANLTRVRSEDYIKIDVKSQSDNRYLELLTKYPLLKQDLILININNKYYPINKNYLINTLNGNINILKYIELGLNDVSSDYLQLPIYKDTIIINNDKVYINNIEQKENIGKRIYSSNSYKLKGETLSDFFNMNVENTYNALWDSISVPTNIAA